MQVSFTLLHMPTVMYFYNYIFQKDISPIQIGKAVLMIGYCRLMKNKNSTLTYFYSNNFIHSAYAGLAVSV